LGGCSSAMSCVDCHDPHAADKPERLAALQSTAGNALCTRCHGKYAKTEALAKHSHHDPNGTGAVCINCHMARKNMGLGYSMTRYHRIGSPTDKTRVEGDRPLECALCHAEKSTAELVATMERFWQKTYDRAVLGRLYGDLSAPNLRSTLKVG